MNFAQKIKSRFRAIFAKRELDVEMDEEMRSHIELRTQANIEAGMEPNEARYAAAREFGWEESLKENCRDQRGVVWIENLFQDVRFGLRVLRKNPGFTIVAVLTLALGIGANTAIFSIVNGVLLKPLSYDQPGQLVQVWEVSADNQKNSVSPGAFLDWREHNTIFEALSICGQRDMNYTGQGEPERIHGLELSAAGMQVLHARPLLGRIFAADEDQPGKDREVMLTYEFWKKRFGGEPNIVGSTVQLDGEGYNVIGILPRRFLLWENANFILPTAISPTDANQRSAHWLTVIGRLKAGITAQQAQSEMKTLMAQLRPIYPPFMKDWSATVVPLREEITGDIKPTLKILAGAVAFILLIACANVANLLLTKASGRQAEIAIRYALGASRGRVLRQLLAESVLLSLLGAVSGILLAYWGVSALVGHNTLSLPRSQEVGLDWRVLVLAVAASVLAGIVFGLAPALQLSRPDLNTSLKDGSRGTGAASRSRLRNSLVVLEVALSMVLLIGAGLLLNSFARLVSVPPGINPKHAFTMEISLPQKKYPDAERRAAFCSRLVGRIASLPGVEAAGAVEMPAFSEWNESTSMTVIGRTNQPAEGASTGYNFCTPNYFRAVGTPLQRGRFFEQREGKGSPREVVVSEAFVRQYFPNEEPLGKQIHLDVFTGKIDEGWEIVGVVGDIHQQSLADAVGPCVYRPQAYAWGASWNLVIRAGGANLVLAETIRKTVQELDPDEPVANVHSLEDQMSASFRQQRFTMLVLGGFAAAALLLAAIGLYGVIAYAVSQRTREIGIRSALGATHGEVIGLILRQGLMLGGIGVMLGIVAALGLTRLMANLLFQIRPTDPLTFLIVSLVLMVVVALACWVPARRAANIDPMTALRQE